MNHFDEIYNTFTDVFGRHWDIGYHPTEDKCIIMFTFADLSTLQGEPHELDCAFWVTDGKVHMTDNTMKTYVCDVPPGFERVFAALSTLKMTDVEEDDYFYD